jgi:predicted lipoprotein with Yx(FWY)xxD motif
MTMGLRPLKTRLVVAAVLAGFGLAAGLAGAAASITMKSTLNSALGSTILVSSAGRTLYHDGSEKRNTVACVGACAKQWLPLVVTAGAKPVAGAGVTASKVGVLKRPDGKMQATYNGLPLYLYAGDSKAGQVNGQGVGGIWHVIAPSGAVVMKAAKPAATSGGASAGGGGYSAGGTTTSTTGGGTPGGATTGGGAGGTTTTTPNDCANNAGGYGCM